MMQRGSWIRVTVTVAVLGLLLAACEAGDQADGEIGDNIESISASLEQDNGGFDLQDESLYFDPGELNLPRQLDYDVDIIQNAEQILSQIPDLPDGVIEQQADQMPAGDSGPMPPAPQVGENQAAPAPGTLPPPPPCPTLLMLGKWHSAGQGFGVYRGVLVAPTPQDGSTKGAIVGFVKGIYGKGRFFGKAVRKDGRARALLKGLYGNGHFKGRFRTRVGVRGLLRGRYAPGRFVGAMAFACKPMCEQICAAGYAMLPEGGCHCLHPCPQGTVLDICPKKVRVCVDVAVSNDDPNTPVGEPGFESVMTRCRVHCAPPVCRAPLPPPPGPPSAPATPDDGSQQPDDGSEPPSLT